MREGDGTECSQMSKVSSTTKRKKTQKKVLAEIKAPMGKVDSQDMLQDPSNNSRQLLPDKEEDSASDTSKVDVLQLSSIKSYTSYDNALSMTQAAPSPKRILLEQEPMQTPLHKVLVRAGFEELTEAFNSEDIFSLEEACKLEVGELRSILKSHGIVATVGLVRRLEKLWREEVCKVRLQNIKQSSDSVISRSMMQLLPEDLKHSLNDRFNSECLFASLMLTIAITVLVTPATPEVCNKELGNALCSWFRCIYMITWGLAVAFFSNATLVSLGSVQLFYGHASKTTVHARFLGAEGYMVLSHVNISMGLMLGILPGSVVNIILRFPEFPYACAAVGLMHWILWLQQFTRGLSAIRQIYSEFPGFDGTWQFIKGYIPVMGGTLTLGVSGYERRSSRISQALWQDAGYAKRDNCPV